MSLSRDETQTAWLPETFSHIATIAEENQIWGTVHVLVFVTAEDKTASQMNVPVCGDLRIRWLQYRTLAVFIARDRASGCPAAFARPVHVKENADING